ncbi:MAG TPA: ABC transporter permease [Candidatus Hydrogenedentes bacterium]|nr:ABC transporter permease [Candidatus Hydrogenedentota bacterium]HQM51135.1 ABC transporter permease [Candidatus Hydrogenedentota bacterium]
MSLFEHLGVALSSLAQNKVRSALTMLGVIIGVLSVILLIALGEGAQAYVEREFAGMGSNILIITPGKQETSGMMPLVAGSFRKLTYNNAKEIERKAAGVMGVSPLVIGAGAVKWGDRQRNTIVIGAVSNFEEVRDIHAQIGRFISEQDVDRGNKVCILGTTVKRELFGNQNALYEKVAINRMKHMVVGILEKKGVMLGIDVDDLVLVPLTSGQQMFYGGEDELFEIIVKAQSAEDIDTATESIRTILTAAHDYTEDFTITDQTSMLDTFGEIFLALRIMLAGIASISLLVGGIGIMNIMLVSVRERTREVGIRKAVGAKRRDIAMQFAIEAVTLSSIGGWIGIALGFVGTFIMRQFLPTFPVYCSAWSIIMAFTFSMTVGVFFGAYPAVKASSVDPVEALRYE